MSQANGLADIQPDTDPWPFDISDWPLPPKDGDMRHTQACNTAGPFRTLAQERARVTASTDSLK